MKCSSDAFDPDFITPVGEPAFVTPDAEKLASLAEFAAGAGHEINNPLATIIGRTQLLLKDEADPQRRQMLTSIGAQAYRIRDMIGDTMLFGRPTLPEFACVDLANVVKSVIDKRSTELANNRCRVNATDVESILLIADSTQLAIVINELLTNSCEALQPSGGKIQISGSRSSNVAVIDVIDYGKGFTDLELRHAFDPFFSGRQAGRGLGFGLPKCWRIIQQHRGQIGIRSIPNGSTTVRVLWPVSTGQTES